MNTEQVVRYIRPVNICSDFIDGASHAILEVSYDLYKTIKKAQKFVKELNGYSFTTFDYSPEWMDCSDTSKDNNELTEEDLSPSEDIIVDTIELKITTESIYWAGYIKHSEPPIEIYTDHIYIKEIDHNFKVLSMPLDKLPLLINHCKYESSKRIAKERLKNGK
jgi:hypothetical protein